MTETGDQFRVIADYAPVLLWVAEPDGRRTFFNQRWLEFTGRTLAAEAGHGWLEGVHPDDREACRAALRSARDARRAFAIEYRLRRHDGVDRWVLDSGSPFHLPDGSFGGFIGSCVDISHRREAEENLRLSEARFRTLFEQSPLSMQILASDGRTRRVNQAWEALWGSQPPDLATSSVLDDSQIAALGIRDLLQSAFAGVPVEIPAAAYAPGPGPSAGKPRWVRTFAYPIAVDENAIREVVLIHEDVTERHRREEADRFLAAAGAVLSTSLDYQTVLGELAQLAAGSYADWCTVDMIDEAGAIRRLAVAHADPTRAELADRLRRNPPTPDKPHPVRQVIETGEPVILSDLSDTLISAIAHDALHLATLRELAARSSMIVPLAARGRIHGAITFMSAESGRRYEPTDLALVEELARRAGIAIDNARLYREAREAIDQRDRALAEADATTNRLQQIIDVLPEAIAIADATGSFTLGNAAATQILGFPIAGEPVPLTPETAFIQFGARRLDGSPYPAEELPLQRALLRGETVLGDQFLIRNLASGSDVPILCNSAPLRDSAGRVTGAVVVFQDISAIKDTERARDAFLASVSHDLKTPLTTIRGLAQLAQRQMARSPVDSERFVSHLNGVVLATDRMTALVNELLDVARLQMGMSLELDRRPVNLIEIVEGVVTDQRQVADRHTIRVVTSLHAVTGNWDPIRIERVISNLIANAVKYSPGGTEIVVSIDEATGRDGRWALLQVHDRGVGILAADLPHIFDRFYRGSNVVGRIAGTGIGLATTRQIVEQHGGTVTVRGREGAGTTFSVRLPLDEAGGG